VDPVLTVDDFALRRATGFTATLPRLRLGRGEAVALFGPSGAGKSSLLHAMLGDPGAGVAVRGQVRLFDTDPLAATPAGRRALLRTKIAWVVQDAVAALDPLLPVGRQIEQATGCAQEQAAGALRELGIADAASLALRLPHQISGGQAQRVLLAVVLLRQPELVVADEPSASLDDDATAELARRLQQLRARGTALLLATHDQRLLDAVGASLLLAADGAFVPGEAVRAPWPPRPRDVAAGRVPVVQCRGVCVQFGDLRVLDGVDLDLVRGEVVALVGPSGAGKTTLARVLCGHLQPQRGTVQRPPRRQAVQMLFQDALGSMTPGRTLRSLIAEARAPFFDPERAGAELALAPELLDRTPARLSGGERRRGALLRALAVNPDVLVLDEPTASLDRATAVAVVGTLLGIRRQRGVALLLVTHDRELAHAVADRVLVLREGRLVA
jgi:peptide/nickel transport system ATP-binding protein